MCQFSKGRTQPLSTFQSPSVSFSSRTWLQNPRVLMVFSINSSAVLFHTTESVPCCVGAHPKERDPPCACPPALSPFSEVGTPVPPAALSLTLVPLPAAWPPLPEPRPPSASPGPDWPHRLPPAVFSPPGIEACPGPGLRRPAAARGRRLMDSCPPFSRGALSG